MAEFAWIVNPWIGDLNTLGKKPTNHEDGLPTRRADILQKNRDRLRRPSPFALFMVNDLVTPQTDQA